MATVVYGVFKVQTTGSGDNQKNYWYQVGSAFPNDVGGFQVVLPEGVSITGNLVIMPPKARN